MQLHLVSLLLLLLLVLASLTDQRLRWLKILLVMA
jgi:hypothetical protein